MKHHLYHSVQGLLFVVLATFAISCSKSGSKPKSVTTAPTIISPGIYMIVNAANPNGCLATGTYSFTSTRTFSFTAGTQCSAIPNQTGTYTVMNAVLNVPVNGQTTPFLHGAITNVTSAGFDYTDAGSLSFPTGSSGVVHFYSIFIYTN